MKRADLAQFGIGFAEGYPKTVAAVSKFWMKNQGKILNTLAILVPLATMAGGALLGHNLVNQPTLGVDTHSYMDYSRTYTVDADLSAMVGALMGGVLGTGMGVGVDLIAGTMLANTRRS